MSLPTLPWSPGQLDLSGQLTNRLLYYGLFEDRDPNPAKDPGYIIMSSFLVFYKWGQRTDNGTEFL